MHLEAAQARKKGSLAEAKLGTCCGGDCDNSSGAGTVAASAAPSCFFEPHCSLMLTFLSLL